MALRRGLYYIALLLLDILMEIYSLKGQTSEYHKCLLYALSAYFSCFLRALNLFQAKALSDVTNVLLGNAWHYTEYDHNVVLWFNRVRAVAMHYIK